MQKREFGSHLRTLREQAGLNQRELAERVGVDFSYLSKIENGVMPPPSRELIIKLAEALHADKDELLTLAGKVPSDIAQILKSQGVLQSLRAGDVANSGASVNKGDSFSKRLRELREAAGLSQAELSGKVGVSFTYLSKIENGVKPPPSEKVILKLAEALNCDKDVLMAAAGKVPSDIARILTSSAVRQSLRENQARRTMMSASGNRIGTSMTSMMKRLMSGRSFSRIALAFVLVVAVAASLWFSSPSAVKALMIEILNSAEGTTIEPATVGQTYHFKMKITIENAELLPVDNVTLSIFNLADPSYVATLTNLPLINGGSANYTSGQTGGGAANVTALTTSFSSRFGYGYAVFHGYTYTFPIGYGYGALTGPATITYDIYWTPPSDWPAGSYQISAAIKAASRTFAEVGNLTLLPGGATVTVTVDLQGGRTNPGYVIPVTVKFFSTLGGNVLTASANYTSNATTSRVGATTNATGNVTGIPPGTYDITVVSEHTLLNVRRGAVITSPSTTYNMGTLLEGDVNGSGSVTILDFSAMIPSYLKSFGDPAYNAMADLDRSGTVNILDFSVAIPNYLKSSPITIP